MNHAPAPALVPFPGGTRPDDVTALRAALRRVLRPALDGGPPPREVLVPHSPEVGSEDALADLRARLHVPVPEGTAVVLQTSGSTTGTGHLVALTGQALVAGAHATEAALAGPGRWVLAVPAHHVAGLQLLVRSVVAGTEPAVVDTTAGFDPRALAATVRDLDDDVPGYLSLVPTQLVRVLQAGEESVAPLRSLAAILVGGAASPPQVLADARAAGLTVRTTYGMTETGGGCVYDGVPLPGVQLRTGDGGRVEISGPVLAAGYLDVGPDADDTFTTEEGVRWLRTRDRGELLPGPDEPDGATTGAVRLRVLGRVDDVINTGGVKVAPTAVERVVAAHPDVAEVAVVGVPDAEWGELVTAVVVPTGEPPRLAELRAAVADRLSGAHAPRALVVLPELPLRGPGKTDRRATARAAAAALGGTGPALAVERHDAGQRPGDAAGSAGRSGTGGR